MSSTDPLIAAAQAGDEVAWRTLYETHQPRLRSWLASLPNRDPGSDADDVAAQAWVTAASKVGSYTGNGDGFGGWLFTIARNHLLNSNRTWDRRDTRPTADGTEPSAATVPDPADDVAGTDRVRRLLATLPDKHAMVVACRDGAGLTVAETAQVLGMSQASVRVTHHRALGRLRVELGHLGTERSGT